MLTLENMQVSQGSFQLTADFSLQAATSTAVIGPSGGGKSSLLSAIAGFIPLAAGKVVWNGVDLASLAPAERPVSLVFQDNNLFGHFSAFQNVAIGMRPSMRLSEGEADQAMAALKRVGLAGLEHRKPAQLSGGQQSRVTLARVLVRAQPLLLLDEPFAALGPGLRADMLALVGELVAASGASLLMVTHEPEDARRITPQTIFVDAGQVHRPQPTAALLDDPPRALGDYLGRL